MKKVLSKIIFLLLIVLLGSPISVFAVDPTVVPAGTGTTGEVENPYAGLEDLGSMHIEMDDDDNVSIKEVVAIQSDTDSVSTAWNFTFEKYRGVLAGICGICTLTFVLIFLVTFVKISSASSNPHQRAELSKALIWIGLGAAGFGSVTVILSLGFGLFKG